MCVMEQMPNPAKVPAAQPGRPNPGERIVVVNPDGVWHVEETATLDHYNEWCNMAYITNRSSGKPDKFVNIKKIARLERTDLF